VTTSGSAGTPVSISGTIEVTQSGGGSSFIHNFTTDGKNSTFYTITGNLSISYGTLSYNNLSLTQCLKMETGTNISFTTLEKSTLTLVFNKAYTGTIKIDGVTFTPSNTEGLVTISSLPVGSHTILKGSGASYLFYMSVVSDSASEIESPEYLKISFFPNPVTDKLNIVSASLLLSVQIFTLSGQMIHQLDKNVSQVDLSHLPQGNYIVRLVTVDGAVSKRIIKE
ncbi:MAG: pel, partial [Bacteroidetes bacterium]|nr:pel [Bacteroidota bacterium]